MYGTRQDYRKALLIGIFRLLQELPRFETDPLRIRPDTVQI